MLVEVPNMLPVSHASTLAAHEQLTSGGGCAIEDAAVLTECIRARELPNGGVNHYPWRVVRVACVNDRVGYLLPSGRDSYHLSA